VAFERPARGGARLAVARYGRAGQRGAAWTSGTDSTVLPDSVFKMIQTESNLFQTDSKFSKL
jgi:hypothetical protein